MNREKYKISRLRKSVEIDKTVTRDRGGNAFC